MLRVRSHFGEDCLEVHNMEGLKRFNEIIQFFKDQGYTEAQLASVYDEIGKAAYDKFVKDTMEHLTTEDMNEISKLDDDDQIVDKVKEFYELRTGRKSEDRMHLHLTTAAEIYLAHHERNVAKSALDDHE